MSRIRGPKDKEYGQKNIDKAPKTFSQRASERRAQNKVDAAKRGQKINDIVTKKNPNSPGAQLAERKSLKASNKITMNKGKETSKSISGIPNKKVGSRVIGPRDSIKSKPAAAATMSKQKQDWLEELVKKYSIPTEEKTDKRGMLNETQLKNLKNGKN